MALFIDDADELHPKTVIALKRLIELVTEAGGQLSIVLIGHKQLKNDLRRPKMEEIGDRTTVFEFGGLWGARTATARNRDINHLIRTSFTGRRARQWWHQRRSRQCSAACA